MASHMSIGWSSLFSPLQVAMNRSCSAAGEGVRRNLVPLWFAGLLGKRSSWMLLPHMTLTAILGQAGPILGPASRVWLTFMPVGSAGKGTVF